MARFAPLEKTRCVGVREIHSGPALAGLPQYAFSREQFPKRGVGIALNVLADEGGRVHPGEERGTAGGALRGAGNSETGVGRYQPEAHGRSAAKGRERPRLDS